jgi:ribosomal protein S18 acetylase RimI-like enzyme
MPVAFGRGKGRSNPAVHWHRQGLPDTTSWMARSRIQDEDREEVAEFVEKHWRSRLVMSRGRAFYPHKEEGFIERRDGRIAGLLTFRVDEEGLEILTLNSVLEGAGIGSSLILDAIQEARTRRCTRVWFTTTNDNIKGFRFYQRLGFRLVWLTKPARSNPRFPKSDRTAFRSTMKSFWNCGSNPTLIRRGQVSDETGPRSGIGVETFRFKCPRSFSTVGRRQMRMFIGQQNNQGLI